MKKGVFWLIDEGLLAVHMRMIQPQVLLGQVITIIIGYYGIM